MRKIIHICLDILKLCCSTVPLSLAAQEGGENPQVCLGRFKALPNVSIYIYSLLVMYTDLGSIISNTDDIGLDHFMVKIVTLTSTFPYTSKHRVTSVSFGYVVDQFHNQYGFSYSGTSKQTCKNDIACVNPFQILFC